MTMVIIMLKIRIQTVIVMETIMITIMITVILTATRSRGHQASDVTSHALSIISTNCSLATIRGYGSP